MKVVHELNHFEKNFEKTPKAHQLRVALILLGVSIVIGGILGMVLQFSKTKEIEKTLGEISQTQKKQMDKRLEVFRQKQYAKEHAN